MTRLTKPLTTDLNTLTDMEQSVITMRERGASRYTVSAFKRISEKAVRKIEAKAAAIKANEGRTNGKA